MTTTPTAKTARVLNEAADLIERNGWCRFALGLIPQEPISPLGNSYWVEVSNPDHLRELSSSRIPCRCCAVGAILYAAGDDLETADLALTTMLDVLPGCMDTSRWNDAADRTADEVTAMLREAARYAAEPKKAEPTA